MDVYDYLKLREKAIKTNNYEILRKNIKAFKNKTDEEIKKIISKGRDK